MRVALVKNLDAGGIYVVPEEMDKEGVRITAVFVDGNKLPDTNYVSYGPRKVDLKLNMPTNTKVEAEVDEL